MGGTKVVDLGNLIPTSSAAVFTNGIGHLDDAYALILYFTSSANANTSAATIQVSQFDPADANNTRDGWSGSTGFFNLYVTASSGVTVAASSGAAQTIWPVAFKGIRLSITTSNAAEIIARVAKQIVL